MRSFTKSCFLKRLVGFGLGTSVKTTVGGNMKGLEKWELGLVGVRRGIAVDRSLTYLCIYTYLKMESHLVIKGPGFVCVAAERHEVLNSFYAAC